jgi:hypothetical protein
MMTDLLFRFCEHDNDLEEDIEWSVSGGALEDTKRYYRIMYNNNIQKMEKELVIDITAKEKMLRAIIQDFKRTVLSWCDSYTSKAFRNEVDALFTTDPWLQIVIL